MVGTPGYTAPEILSKKDYNQLCDIFSLGIVLFNLLTNQRPFRRIFVQTKPKTKNNGPKEYNHDYELMVSNSDIFWSKYGNMIDNDCKQFIISLTKKHPNDRSTIGKIKVSKWYNDFCYDLPHVLKYQVLSLFRNLKKKEFDKKFSDLNEKEQAKKIVY